MVGKGVTSMSDNPVRPLDLAAHTYGGGQASFVVPIDWPEQNGRRFELMHKKWQGGGLDAAESAELARLQAVARTVVAAALPPPLLTPAERAYVDSKAGH